MTKPVIYQYTDYREYLKDLTHALKECGEGFTLGILAAAIGIQNPYLSKVFKGDADLNSDQLFLASEFLKLADEESYYLNLLLEVCRAQVPKRKQQLMAQVESLQNQFRQTKKHIRVEDLQVQSAARQEYFLDPHLQLIYAALTIPKYQANIALARETLAIPQDTLEYCLSRLEAIGMIRREGKTWQITQSHFHLLKQDPLCRPYQHLLRMKSNEQVMRLPQDASYNFVWTITMDEKTRAKIQDAFLKFLEQANAWVHAAPSEAMYQINFELFPWETKPK